MEYSSAQWWVLSLVPCNSRNNGSFQLPLFWSSFPQPVPKVSLKTHIPGQTHRDGGGESDSGISLPVVRQWEKENRPTALINSFLKKQKGLRLYLKAQASESLIPGKNNTQLRSKLWCQESHVWFLYHKSPLKKLLRVRGGFPLSCWVLGQQLQFIYICFFQKVCI